MRLFLDTSACAKRYVAERGSDQVLALSLSADALVVSAICLPELVSTLTRLLREKRLTKPAFRALKSRIVADLADCETVAVDSGIIARGVLLLEAHPLRTLDALHVASALSAEIDRFVSADNRQLAAAKNAGLSVEDVTA